MGKIRLTKRQQKFRYVSGTVWQVVVIAFVLPLIFSTVGAFPGGAKFLVDLFWESLGEIEIFNGAATALSKFMENSKAEVQETLLSLLGILAKALMQACILGACVSVVTTKMEVIGAPVLNSVIGFAIGLVLVFLLETTNQSNWQWLFYVMATIGVLLVGMGVSLGLVGKGTGGSIWRHTAPFLGKTLLGALYSTAVTGAITALMVAPSLVHAGKSALAAIGWYLLMAAFMLILVFIFYISKEEKK